MQAQFATPAEFESIPHQDPEARRLAELYSYDILDTPREERFDSIAALAGALFDTPISAITLVDRDRQWFKASQGLDLTETPRADSFCNHTMQQQDVFIVNDASQDPRFANNPLVQGEPNIRFYAGAALRSPGGESLGAVCVISPDAREGFSESDQRKLSILARVVSNEMALKKRAQGAHRMLMEHDLAVREAHFRIRNSVEYANLLAEVQSEATSTEQIAAMAMVAWKQYAEAGGILQNSIRTLRKRMTAKEYADLLAQMPGFAL